MRYSHMEDKFTQADGEVLRKTGASMGVFNLGKGREPRPELRQL